MIEGVVEGVIEGVIENWHKYIAGELEGGLDQLLADDVVFYSPVVFTPQKGKDVTKLYLTAAAEAFSGAAGAEKDASAPSNFRYCKEVLSDHQAVLEFETHIDGKYINGVDIITCNDVGQIIEFKVMVRPLQAINLLHAQMQALLRQIQSSGS